MKNKIFFWQLSTVDLRIVGKVSSRAIDYKWIMAIQQLDRQKSRWKATDCQTVFFFTIDDHTSFGFAASGVNLSAHSGHSVAAHVVSEAEQWVNNGEAMGSLEGKEKEENGRKRKRRRRRRGIRSGKANGLLRKKRILIGPHQYNFNS